MKNKITPWDILNYSLQNIFFKGIEVDIAGVQKSEETIANFQWFLRRPSPLNVFWAADYCHQWFYDGFLMLLPSLSMVFVGSRPLVNRCDGFDGSLWSSTAYISINHPSTTVFSHNSSNMIINYLGCKVSVACPRDGALFHLASALIDFLFLLLIWLWLIRKLLISMLLLLTAGKGLLAAV